MLKFLWPRWLSEEDAPATFFTGMTYGFLLAVVLFIPLILLF